MRLAKQFTRLNIPSVVVVVLVLVVVGSNVVGGASVMEGFVGLVDIAE